MSSNSARLGAVLEWATTFVDACAPDDMRIGVKVSLASAAAADPDTVATALAGLASDMAATLPATDPWRFVPPDAFMVNPSTVMPPRLLGPLSTATVTSR